MGGKNAALIKAPGGRSFQLKGDGQRHLDLDGLAALLARLKPGLAHDAEGLLVAPGPDAANDRRLGHMAVFIDDELNSAFLLFRRGIVALPFADVGR